MSQLKTRRSIYDQVNILPDTTPVSTVPRAIGSGQVVVKSTPRGSALADLHMSGCLKLLFTRAPARVDGVLLNTAGGLTGGDQMTLTATVQDSACLTLTTQAAERAYRAPAGTARVRTALTAKAGATLFWLPQELILFEGAKLDRELACELAQTARALLVEPVIFGRQAMGERLQDILFSDRIRVTRAGRPLFQDAMRVAGDAQRLLARSALAAGGQAMVTLLYIAPDAEAKLAALRPLLTRTAGATLVQPDVMVLRALAEDSLALRRMLLPMLDVLTDHTLPTSWRL